MSTLSFDEFFKKNTWISCLTALVYTPKIIRKNVENRQCNSFLYVISGTYKYKNISKPFTADQGSLIYVPCGSFHSYEITLLPVQALQIDFDLYYDGIKYAFSDEPFVVTENVSQKAYELMTELTETHSFDNIKRRLKTNSVMYELFSELSDCFPHFEKHSPTFKKIEPAVNYIENHYNENFSAELLCGLCLIGESQLRRLFKQNVGMSPGEYKTKFRINKACTMLIADNLGIAEISDVLGFDNVYYFSKVFKKITGLSPGKYRKKHILP